MILRMTEKFYLIIICIFILTLVFTITPRHCHSFEITIDIAPNVLNLQNQGQVVTVHTDIKFGEVDASTIYMNDIPISSWKADNRGYFVAKFLMSDIKNIVYEGYYTFTLIGATTDGTLFWGSQTIIVVNNIPVGGN